MKKRYLYLSKEQGELLRKTRQALKLNQEDLSDETISTGTISAMENASSRVSYTKLEIYCKKLNLNVEEVLNLGRGSVPDEDYKLWYMSIAQAIDRHEFDVAMRKLNQIQSKEPRDLAWLAYYKGRIAIRKKSWETARVQLTLAYELAAQLPKKENIIPLISYDLSRVEYYENRWSDALYWVQNAINLFDRNGERQYLYENLLISRILYLQKQHRIMDAWICLQDMKKELLFVSSSVRLNMIEMEAELLNAQGLYEDAIEIALTGLDLARIEQKHDRLLYLWTVLGISYQNIGNLTKAETCFLEAIEYREKMKVKSLLVYTYRHLAELYYINNNLDKAEEYVKEAIRLGEKTKEALWTCESYRICGDIYRAKGRKKRAEECYLRSEQLAEMHQLQEQDFHAIACYLEMNIPSSDSLKSKFRKLRDYLIEYKSKEKEALLMQKNANRSRGKSDPPES